MTIREKFVESFSEDQAQAIEAAAEEHKNEPNSKNRGSDPFKWALLICIGYECLEREEFRVHHKITIPWDDIDAWMIEYGDFASHDGDCDYFAMFIGRYNKYCANA